MKPNLPQLAAIGLALSVLSSCSSSKQRIDYSWFRDTLTAAQEDSVNVEAGEGLAEALPAADTEGFTPPAASPAPAAAPQPAPAPAAAPAADTTAKQPTRVASWFSQRQPAPAQAEAAAQTTYTVQKGDVLSAIAKRHRVSTAALAKANNLANPNALRIGQVLIIPRAGVQQPAAPKPAAPTPTPAAPAPATAPATPVAAPAAPAAAPAPQAAPTAGYYTVCSGDTLARIARRYNTSIQKLMQANNMTQAQANRLKIGQRILLPRN